MEEVKEKTLDSTGTEITFQHGYQKRSREDIFKLFLFENRKSIRGFVRVQLILVFLFVVWLLSKNLVVLVAVLLLAGLTAISLIGFLNIWLSSNNFENAQIPSRAFVQERTLKYGDFGIVFKELSKQGLSEGKFAGNRYKYVVEWEKFLHPIALLFSFLLSCLNVNFFETHLTEHSLHNPRQSLFDSVSEFTPDFMNERNQPSK